MTKRGTRLEFEAWTDSDQITSARSRYNARKTESSLIAWICSPAWTDPLASTLTRGQSERGCKVRRGIWIGTESTWGEINAE